ncbi:MAG: patatin-like phospholipase family protein [Lewinellaceae bacterium]|nr:patatin-like phospholipase family protein [Phaeodactylibacter sp.]MCB9040967.1 patatin-like phospholipase family protein [Lewinellaceae bacterium]
MAARKRIGLALSGGGARGIAHIGVLQALEEQGIFPEVISGASAGAIVGALYAAGKTPEEIMEFVRKASFFKMFKVAIPFSGLTKLTYLRDKLAESIPEDRFEALEKKLFVAIANLNTGECEMRSSGALFDVVTASSSIPLLFQPVEIDGQLYLDGGLLDNMPVEPIKPFCDVAIAVNVMPHVKVPNKAVQNVLGIAQRCFDLSVLANTRPGMERCDLLIEPKEVHDFNIFQLNRYEPLFDIGYKAAMERMGALRELIGSKVD